MSFAKESQVLSLEGTDVLISPQSELIVGDINDLRMPSHHKPFAFPVSEDLVVEEPEDQIAIELDGDAEPELVLTLDKVPGGAFQDEISHEEAVVEVEEPEDVEVNTDPWDWGGVPSKFLPWLSKMMQAVPAHSGRDTAGLERAIAYLEALDRQISRAVRTDLNNEIAIEAVEKARDEIQNGLERLEERLEKVKESKYPKTKNKKKKKADDEPDGLVKEAQKAPHVGGIIVSVPLFISGLARVCINGTISGGHDIEHMLKLLIKKFKLTERDQFELVQLIQDMNYPVRRDRGFLLDEEIDTSSSDNFDWNTNYNA